MSTMSPRLIADLIGAPYAERGRGPHAFDCEGLFLEVQRRRGYAGSVPPAAATEQRARAWMHIAVGEWRELSRPQAGCAVFFAADLHVGTMYDRSRFLHTTSEFGEAYLETLDSPFWCGKTPRFYDWMPA